MMTPPPSPVKHGYRGYIGVRMAMGRCVPQHIQQMVIRDYCARRGFPFLLSATEYCMEGSTLVLETVLEELPTLEGIVFYSLYQMPQDRATRMRLYTQAFAHHATVHCAAESIAISDWDAAMRLEETWQVADILAQQAPDTLTTLRGYAYP